MNQRGDVFANILIFIAVLLILGLYVGNLENPFVSMIQSSPTSGQGTDTYMIFIAAPIFIMLYAIWYLTKSPDSLSFGGA